MDVFTDQDSKGFLNKEWLIKIDNANSRPYLFKFCRSEEDRCSILITDTANVWFEALDSKQIARRWRRLNKNSVPLSDQDEEYAWRTRIFRKLSAVHTLKSVQDSVFSVEDSRDADLAFELQTIDCKWRWECYLLGPKTSAQILSKHLIFPLLSVTHLAFTSADPVCELSTEDLQQAVDKVAKSGRRAQDVHVRQTMSRPRVATSLARMTAMFNFAEPIPPILSVSDEVGEVEDVDMATAEVHTPDRLAQPSAHAPLAPSSNTWFQNEPSLPMHVHDSSSLSAPNPNSTTTGDPSHSPTSNSAPRQKQKQKSGTEKKATPAPESSSATEPETDDEAPVASVGPSQPQIFHGKSQASESEYGKRPGPSSRASSSRPPQQADSSSDSSPPRPASKKAKLNVVPEDSDSSGDQAGRKGSATSRTVKGASAARGVSVRQPIKRGGRRF